MPVDIDFAKVGIRIRTLRKKHNMTQEDLAHICGCTSNHLSAIETGEHKPSLDLLLKLAVSLDTCIDYFLSDTPYASPNYLINSRIAPKLESCSTRELQYIELFIDELLKYRGDILSSQ